MQRFLVFLAAGAATIITIAPVQARPYRDSDRTPLTCDSHSAKFHVARARQLIRFGYDKDRLPDPTPMRRGEKAALVKHKFCLFDDGRHKRIERFRDHVADRYRAKIVVEPEGWPSPESVGVSSSTLAAIRACESGGDYSVIDASGTYYGAYQFDLGTWASVGGAGQPNEASPAEQDYRAALLYSRSGASPWPVCGV